MKLAFERYIEEKEKLRKKYVYEDWFGSVSLIDRIDKAIEIYGEPRYVWIECEWPEHCGICIAVLEYKDKLIVVGYDGKEYEHEFVIHA